MLTNRYWSPIKNIVTHNIDECLRNKYTKILELGPGYVHFPLSNYFVDNDDTVISEIQTKNTDAQFIKCDLNTTKLDYDDNFFDFGYARHIFEDVQNPDFIFAEFSRVCNSGYIETPSPLVESIRGVDAHPNSNLYKGYIHHRYIMWTEGDELHAIPKLPIIEYLNLPDPMNEMVYNIANTEPLNWNNYYWWDKKEGKQPKFVLHKNFSIPNDYSQLIIRAINGSLNNNKIIFEKLIK